MPHPSPRYTVPVTPRKTPQEVWDEIRAASAAHSEFSAHYFSCQECMPHVARFCAEGLRLKEIYENKPAQ